MMKPIVPLALLCLVLPGCAPQPGPPPAQPEHFGRATPEEAGFTPRGLAELETYLEEAGSSSMILAHDGRIVFEWGDTRRRHTVHSIRKSLLNSLYGIYVARGVIDTAATLAELGIDDAHGLTPAEQRARVADLLRSRSGVYHPAAAVSEGMLMGQPARGSHAPGEAYYYNNWDFNVLGAILERETGRSVFELFRDEIARPIGMLHYEGTRDSIDGDDPDAAIPNTDGFYQYERSRSDFPAYHFRLSAHDLALYGQLWLDRGRWGDTQILPESWVDASTRAYSVTNPQIGIGYGMLWFVLLPNEERAAGSFYHTGAGVHMLAVYPGSKLVMVHRVDTENGSGFTGDRLYRVISLVFEARE